MESSPEYHDQILSAVEVALPGLPQPLSYAVPSHLHRTATVGSEVTVELGSRSTSGWIVSSLSIEEATSKLASQIEGSIDKRQLSLLPQDSAIRLKQIQSALPAFPPEQLPLFQWMASYYGASLAEVVENALPRRALTVQHAAFIDFQGNAEDPAAWETAIAQLSKRAEQQKNILEILRESGGSIASEALFSQLPSARSALRSLEEKQLIRWRRESRQETAVLEAGLHASDFFHPAPQALTTSQESAVTELKKAIDTGSFQPSLLFGVTGSGKTEVYLRAIEHTLQYGRSALVIVPEIALTPQLLDRFVSRLKIPMVVLHSQVGATQRWSAWDAILRGEIRLAIGARSAIFAPLKNLGLIVVDEEHESSYKQSDGLRYHGRDVAVMRAKFEHCPIVLGSATPSFESLLNVKRGRYALLELPDRVTQRPLPQMEVVDLNRLKKSSMPSPNISPALYDALQDTLAKKEQAIILYNKRGFASYLQCDTCQEAYFCPQCSVTMTYHRHRNRVMCHYCNTSFAPPEHCPYCRDPRTTQVEIDAEGELTRQQKKIDAIGKLTQRGAGTEKVVEELAELFPQATIRRMDRDTVGKKESYREILGSMRSRAADILVGTQMIAKGHDLPGVTLVGIIDADVGLHIPDFRSSEKAFQLITQAAGRAGRAELAGRVILQTHEPHHPTIVAAATNRFKAFVRYELEYRKSLGYPPWGRLLRVVVSSPSQTEVYDAVDGLQRYLGTLLSELRCNDESSDVTVVGPAPAPHERLRERYRWHFIVKSASAKFLSTIAHHVSGWHALQKDFADVRITVDIDPIDML